MTRYRASGIHLAISIAVSSSLLAVLWFVWYPSPLLRALGGAEVFLLLICVDVALGPVLTLVVFNTGKRTLRFDLAVIGIVQLAALLYGVYTMFLGRPIYLAGDGSRFVVVQASDLDPKQTNTSWSGPQWVGFALLNDPKEHEKLMFTGFNYAGFQQTHVQLGSLRQKFAENGKSIDTLKRLNPGREAEIDTWLAAHGQQAASVKFVPLQATAEAMVVILDANTAEVVAIAPFKPWS